LATAIDKPTTSTIKAMPIAPLGRMAGHPGRVVGKFVCS